MKSTEKKTNCQQSRRSWREGKEKKEERKEKKEKEKKKRKKKSKILFFLEDILRVLQRKKKRDFLSYFFSSIFDYFDINLFNPRFGINSLVRIFKSKI